MKTKADFNEFFEKTYRLICAFKEMPFMLRGEYGVYMSVKFKPVFYVRPEIMDDIVRFSHSDIKLATITGTDAEHCESTRFAPTLYGIELYVTRRKDAPDVALALEPIQQKGIAT